jgi:hypothetical protein
MAYTNRDQRIDAIPRSVVMMRASGSGEQFQLSVVVVVSSS